MRKEWHTPPEVVTSQIRDSASASEILERLGQERNNPGLNLINIGTSWEGLANFGHTVVREVEEESYDGRVCRPNTAAFEAIFV